MGTSQSIFGTTFAKGFAGMRANTEPENVISRTMESALSAASGWGQPAFRGSNDHGCVAGAAFSATAAAAAAASGNIGTGAITAAPAVALPAKEGRYKAVLIATGSTAPFLLYDPDGVVVGDGVVASAATIDGIGPFTIANAGTMTAGDAYYIDVTYAAGVGKLLGLIVPDPSVPAVAAIPDGIPQNFTASIINEGVVWVTAGGAVAPGNKVYWKQSNGRYTASAADGIEIKGAVFEDTGVDTNLVRIAIRKRIVA